MRTHQQMSSAVHRPSRPEMRTVSGNVSPNTTEKRLWRTERFAHFLSKLIFIRRLLLSVSNHSSLGLSATYKLNKTATNSTVYTTSILVIEDTRVGAVSRFEQASEAGSEIQGDLISFQQQSTSLPHQGKRDKVKYVRWRRI